MDLENNEFLNFVKAANESHLEYLLIGGLALAMHGIPRYTQDADVWIKPTNDNKSNFLKTLVALGYEKEDLVSIEDLDFSEAQIVRLEGPIDILTVVHFRMEYAACRERAREFVTGPGYKIYFVHINDLREFKVLSRRPKDLNDIIMIDQLLDHLKDKKNE